MNLLNVAVKAVACCKDFIAVCAGILHSLLQMLGFNVVLESRETAARLGDSTVRTLVDSSAQFYDFTPDQVANIG